MHPTSGTLRAKVAQLKKAADAAKAEYEAARAQLSELDHAFGVLMNAVIDGRADALRIAGVPAEVIDAARAAVERIKAAKAARNAASEPAL